MITAATVVARGFLPAMITRFALRRTLDRLCQLEPPGPVTIRLGAEAPAVTYLPLPFFIGQTVRIVRDELIPMARGRRAVVTGYVEGGVRLDVEGMGVDFIANPENLEPVSR